MSPNSIPDTFVIASDPLEFAGRDHLPYYILVRHPTGTDITTDPGKIEKLVPVVADKQNLTPQNLENSVFTWNLKESAQALFNVGLHLNKGDRLRLYYVDDFTTVETFQGSVSLKTLAQEGNGGLFAQGYRLVRNGTSFDVNFLGCRQLLL